MAEVMTKPSTKSVTHFLDAVEPQQRREDAFELLEIMKDISGEEPELWGPSIIGFGKYHYKYASGHEGDMCRVGFSPRKSSLVLYLMPGFDTRQSLLKKLGKHKTSVSCLYINKLADVDIAILKALIKQSLTEMNELYPDN
ncbi:MAG: hypothetical protein QG639_1139 [Patescibacteria group bacterium]|nr:hypothetical protein [Patescibacteria group bacterium]